MKHPRGIVLAGALGALALMTALSAAAGTALPALLPRLYTHYASVALFVIFGAKLLRDAAGMDSAGPSEELEVGPARRAKPPQRNRDGRSAPSLSLPMSMSLGMDGRLSRPVDVAIASRPYRVPLIWMGRSRPPSRRRATAAGGGAAAVSARVQEARRRVQGPGICVCARECERGDRVYISYIYI